MREKEGQKYQSVVAPCMPPTGDQAFNLAICPRLGITPSDSQALTQSTEPHRPRCVSDYSSSSSITSLYTVIYRSSFFTLDESDNNERGESCSEKDCS